MIVYMLYSSDIPENFIFSVIISDYHITGVAGIEPTLEESKSSALPFGYTPITRQKKEDLLLCQMSYL